MVDEPVDKVYGGCERNGTADEHPVDFGQVRIGRGVHSHAAMSVRHFRYRMANSRSQTGYFR